MAPSFTPGPAGHLPCRSSMWGSSRQLCRITRWHAVGDRPRGHPSGTRPRAETGGPALNPWRYVGAVLALCAAACGTARAQEPQPDRELPLNHWCDTTRSTCPADGVPSLPVRHSIGETRLHTAAVRRVYRQYRRSGRPQGGSRLARPPQVHQGHKDVAPEEPPATAGRRVRPRAPAPGRKRAAAPGRAGRLRRALGQRSPPGGEGAARPGFAPPRRTRARRRPAACGG